MRSIKKLGLASVAVLAVAAFVGVASASAFTNWTVDGAVASGQTVSIAPLSTDPLKLHDSFTGVTVTCSSGSGGGTVSGGSGTVTSGSSTGCSSSNTFLCPGPVSATAVNTPWATSISGIRDNITNTNGNPGWKTTCSNGTTVTCTGNTSAALSNNGTSSVKSTFDTSSATGKCTDGGTGSITGSVIVSITGHNLQVV